MKVTLCPVEELRCPRVLLSDHTKLTPPLGQLPELHWALAPKVWVPLGTTESEEGVMLTETTPGTAEVVKVRLAVAWAWEAPRVAVTVSAVRPAEDAVKVTDCPDEELSCPRVLFRVQA